MVPPEPFEPRALVHRVDAAVQKYFSGLAEQAVTIDLIDACCEQLRAGRLDEQSRYLVGFIAHCAKLLRSAHGDAGAPGNALPDLASVRIELMKGIWQLDAHLLGESG